MEVERIVPKKGKILDLGCGEGIFTNYMALSSSKRKILGIELNKERVVQADKGIKNVNFKYGNALTSFLPKSDVIVLFHLLHHLLSFSDQEKLIKKCSRSLNKGGCLVVVEVDIKPTFKYLVSWLTDHFVVPILFNHYFFEKNIFFRGKKDWLFLLKENNFECKAISMEKGKPFTHIVFKCIKK